ncbi:uncharacterized protein BDV17DRAFT_284302 [Aspergillus undulatus]|uniref:uncharacterized protein n=1 Tax=Aspergillus undulatus TaxID=1810928 RepID=UPI003CCCDD54
MPSGIQKPTRRYHRKSRTGCTGCRSRRIKARHTLRALSVAGYPQNETSSPSNSSGIPPSLLASAESTTTFDMLDLSLMHHYTTTTSISLFGEEQRELWQIEVPIMARSSSLLMHGLLATAALHMAFLNKDDSDSSVYTSRALYHHSLGLELFNAHITSLSAENSNSHVLFTFGLFLVIWAYASPTLPSAPTASGVGNGVGINPKGTGDLSTLLASLELVRGNKVIFELSSETILAQPIGRFTMPSEDLQTRITQSLTHLRHKIATDFIDTIAIDHLERALLDTISTSASDMRQPLGWPALVEAPFWDRVRRRKPSALLILMHYAIILAYYERRAWWMENWSETLVGAVQEALKEHEECRSYSWAFPLWIRCPPPPMCRPNTVRHRP